jgi:hypothetical protein
MKWKNANTVKPKNNDLVLIEVNGSYHICIYDKGENIYRLKDQIGTYYVPKKVKINWVEFTPPMV